MASTRNKNTFTNYRLQQQINTRVDDWMLYKHGAAGIAYSTAMPGNGLLPGQIPSNLLSSNAVDIDSFLRGIRSVDFSNPVHSPPVLTPQINQLPTVNIYQKPPTYVPEPVHVIPGQRPLWGGNVNRL